MPNEEPFWLPLDFIVAANRAEVETTGENHAVVDVGRLEGACARPRQMWHYSEGRADLPALAVGLLFGIARNHPFEQGNKRTAFVAAVAFLEANGCALHLEDYESHAQDIIDVLNGTSEEHGYADRLRMAVESSPSGGR